MALSTTRRGVMVVLLGSIVLAVAGACAASDPPPRSPLGDTGTAVPATGTNEPLPTFPPTEPPGASPAPTASATGTPAGAPTADRDAEAERVAGEAISRLAEWTGIPETEFSLLSVEAVDWPSACLGLTVPSIACAEVITPGYRVEIAHAGLPAGTPYTVHANRTGRYLWAPHFDAVRVIEAVDPGTRTLRFTALSGSDEMGREHRVAPGSYLEVPFADLSPGDRVHVAVTWPPPGEAAGLIVWLVPLGS